jgi:hypothetical protein
MARRAEARAPMVAGADLWLAEAAIPCGPRRAGISRNDLSESLYSDTRRAEQGADGAPADSAADAPGQSKPLPIDYEQRCSDRLNPPSKSDIAPVKCDVRFTQRTLRSATRTSAFGSSGHQWATIRSLLLTLIESRAPERYSTNLIFDLSQRRLCDSVGTER